MSHTIAFAAENCGKAKEYTVSPQDNLTAIGQHFGHHSLWQIIYVANADVIGNPNLIYPGQTLNIPPSVVAYQNGNLSLADVRNNPFCDMADVPFEDAEPSLPYFINLDFYIQKAAKKAEEENYKAIIRDEQQTEEEILDEFRDAFKGLMTSQKQSDQTGEFDTEAEMMLELDGMVLDETRTRIGRDFYDVFYRNWQAPDKARNFTVTVSEQPTPNLGTIISVSVNGSYTFRHRLQPRHDIIVEAGQAAVQTTYNHLEGNQQQTRIY